LESKLLDMTSQINGTFPMLEFEPGALMCDSLAIVALLVRTSAKGNKDESLLGSTLKEQNDQIEWINFMKETVNPKIEALKMMVYGQYLGTKVEFEKIYDDFMKNMEVF
jgi:glutathione S-transferase